MVGASPLSRLPFQCEAWTSADHEREGRATEGTVATSDISGTDGEESIDTPDDVALTLSTGLVQSDAAASEDADERAAIQAEDEEVATFR
jgi:hypothetical protein